VLRLGQHQRLPGQGGYKQVIGEEQLERPVELGHLSGVVCLTVDLVFQVLREQVNRTDPTFSYGRN
jgi:hypothetical protein